MVNIYTLTDEEVKNLILEYRCRQSTVERVERLVNLFDADITEDDYRIIVEEVISLHTSTLLRINTADIKPEKIGLIFSLEEIVRAVIRDYMEEKNLPDLDEYYDQQLFLEYPENNYK